MLLGLENLNSFVVIEVFIYLFNYHTTCWNNMKYYVEYFQAYVTL